MEHIFLGFVGKQVNVGCGSSAGFKGEVVSVGNGVVCLKNEDETVSYIAVDKVVFVSEANVSHSRPGFVI